MLTETLKLQAASLADLLRMRADYAVALAKDLRADGQTYSASVVEELIEFYRQFSSLKFRFVDRRRSGEFTAQLDAADFSIRIQCADIRRLRDLCRCLGEPDDERMNDLITELRIKVETEEFEAARAKEVPCNQ